MAKELRCRDVGMDCNAVIRGQSEDEVMKKAVEHARSVHGLQKIDDQMAKKVKSLIRTA